MTSFNLRRHALKLRAVGLLLALSQFIALLCGCSALPKASPEEVSEALTAPFSVNVAVTCRGSEYTAELVKKTDGSYEVKLLSPALFKGMEISFDGETAAVTYNGLTFTLDPSRLPAASAIKALVSALDGAALPDELTAETTEDGELAVSGEGFTLYAERDDARDGFTVSRLEIPEQELVAVFSDFTPAD